MDLREVSETLSRNNRETLLIQEKYAALLAWVLEMQRIYPARDSEGKLIESK